MSAKSRQTARQKGSALLATLCFAAVLSLSLSSYLAVCYRSLVLSNRTMQSSHGLELANVGMEEALWAMNNGGFDSTWLKDTGTWTATKTLNTGFTYENGAVGQVTVTVVGYNKTVADFTVTGLQPTITITSVGKVTLGDRTVVARALQSNVQPAKLFTNALGATNSLLFAIGGGGTVDSYTISPTANRADPATLDPSTYTYGFSATVSGASVDLSTASIYGYATTKGTTIQATTAKVAGDFTGTDIDANRVSTNGTQPLFDPAPPTGGVLTPPALDLTATDSLNQSGVYHVNSINLGDAAVLTINAPNVILKVSNSVQTSGSGRIVVTPGSSLELQIDENDGQGLVLQGTGGIDNQTLLPQNLSVVLGGNVSTTTPGDITRSYAGTPTSTIDVPNPFFGTIYLPNDTIHVGDSTIFGSVVGQNIIFTGTAPVIHYATDLRKIGIQGVTTPLAVVQLREVSPPAP